MMSRAGHIGPFVLKRTRQGNARRIFIALFMVTALMLYVAGKVKIVRLGYQIETMEREKKELERENRSLRIEASSLTASARIEEIAINRLGMIRPLKDNIVVVKRKGHGKIQKE